MEGVGREERQLEGGLTHRASLNGAEMRPQSPWERCCPLCESRGTLRGQGSGWRTPSPLASLAEPPAPPPSSPRTFRPRLGLASHFLWPVSPDLVVGTAFVFLSLLSFLLKALWRTLRSILERRL